MIKFEDVIKSYNGRRGCMCGCNGRYRLASHANIDEINRSVGYPLYDEDDVSDRAVRIAVNRINRNVDWEDPQAIAALQGKSVYKLRNGKVDDGRFEILIMDDCASIDVGDRTTAVYFKKAA